MVNTSKPRKKSHKAVQAKEPFKEPIKVVDYYRDIRTWKMREATNSYLENLCDALLKWAARKDALHLTEFCSEVGISRGSFNMLSQRHENVREAKEEAQRMIAARREVGAVTSRLNASAVKDYQALHCEEFKAYQAWKAALTKEEEKKEEKVVIIERYPDKE
jgi:hypothetical protein